MSELMQQIDRHIIGSTWTSSDIHKSLLHLCDDIGHRFGGSSSEHAAAEYLAEKMSDYGLRNVHLEEFPMYSWERGECFLALTSPVERSFSAISMPYTGSGQFEAEIVDVGEGEKVDFDRLNGSGRGKIILTDAETNRPGQTKSHRTDKFKWAEEAGAIACIFINQNPGLLHITGALYGRKPGSPDVADHESSIPGIGVSYEAGMAIRRLSQRGTPEARIRVKNTTYVSKSYNPVGDVPGSSLANEVVVFGGHYDGHDIAQGASDDAAGTLVGVELGRALAPFAGKLKRTVRVVCFGCEEIGLLGSWTHADRYANQSEESLEFVMNLDGAGRGAGGHEDITVTGDPEMVPYFEKMSEELNYDFPVRNGLSAHSDHFPFFLAGYPSATLRSQDATAGMIGRGYGHTEADTTDKVTLRGLQMSSVLAARVAARLADAELMPGNKRTEEQVRSVLEDRDMAHFLEHHWGRANRA